MICCRMMASMLLWSSLHYKGSCWVFWAVQIAAPGVFSGTMTFLVVTQLLGLFVLGEVKNMEKNLEEEEMAKEDDILLWRQIFLFMIASYSRRARGHDHPLAFVLEQPSSPKHYMPEVVSFWDQWEWQEIKKEFSLKETCHSEEPRRRSNKAYNSGNLFGLGP